MFISTILSMTPGLVCVWWNANTPKKQRQPWATHKRDRSVTHPGPAIKCLNWWCLCVCVFVCGLFLVSVLILFCVLFPLGQGWAEGVKRQNACRVGFSIFIRALPSTPPLDLHRVDCASWFIFVRVCVCLPLLCAPVSAGWVRGRLILQSFLFFFFLLSFRCA